MAIEVEPLFNRKKNVVMDGVMTLRASNQVLLTCGHYIIFYDIMLSTE